jgi:hypothetical protein
MLFRTTVSLTSLAIVAFRDTVQVSDVGIRWRSSAPWRREWRSLDWADVQAVWHPGANVLWSSGRVCIAGPALQWVGRPSPDAGSTRP